MSPITVLGPISCSELLDPDASSFWTTGGVGSEVELVAGPVVEFGVVIVAAASGVELEVGPVIEFRVPKVAVDSSLSCFSTRGAVSEGPTIMASLAPLALSLSTCAVGDAVMAGSSSVSGIAQIFRLSVFFISKCSTFQCMSDIMFAS